MTIGLDISQIVYSGTGSARYNKGAVDSILHYDKQQCWKFFFSALRRKLDPELKAEILNKQFQLSQFPFSPQMLHFLWNKVHILNVNSLIGPTDWFITSDWAQPPAQAKTATLVHDLAFKRYPEVVAPLLKQAQTMRLQKAQKEASLFLCLSQATKQDLLHYFDIKDHQACVLYPGVELTEVTDDQIKETVNKFNLEKPFILTVGKIEPRKNLLRLLDAYRLLDNNDIDLVIVGPQGWEQIEKSKYKNVHFTGYVSEVELSCLYKSCFFFAFPSIWEGFGYPLVEAMLSKAPTTAANTSSLKEIGEGYSLLFNPLEVEDIKNSLQKMIESESLRTELIQKGKERSKMFTQQNYYNNLMQILNRNS